MMIQDIKPILAAIIFIIKFAGDMTITNKLVNASIKNITALVRSNFGIMVNCAFHVHLHHYNMIKIADAFCLKKAFFGLKDEWLLA